MKVGKNPFASSITYVNNAKTTPTVLNALVPPALLLPCLRISTFQIFPNSRLPDIEPIR